MSRRRNGTNQAMIQLGLNRYKLGKKKRPGAATPAGAEKITYTGKYSRQERGYQWQVKRF